MNGLLAELPPLQRVLASAVAASPPGSVDVTCVDRYIRGMRRKCLFATVHLQLLQTVDWSQIDGLGRETGGIRPPDALIVSLRDSKLEIRHPGAVIEHVYLATDGLVAAVVNLTDTFGRLVNEVYQLGIAERQASLVALRNKCLPTSSLGQVLHDPLHDGWLRYVKDLRGRCQHADLEEVLTTPRSCLGTRAEPHVPSKYCWQHPSVDMPLAAYARVVSQAAELTLIASCRAITSCTTNPTA